MGLRATQEDEKHASQVRLSLYQGQTLFRCILAAATELSSRPERSVVEGPAVPRIHSQLPPEPTLLPCHPERSRGICSAPCGSLPSFLGSDPDKPAPPHLPLSSSSIKDERTNVRSFGSIVLFIFSAI